MSTAEDQEGNHPHDTATASVNRAPVAEPPSLPDGKWLRRRTVRLPTWRLWLISLAAAVVAIGAAIPNFHAFLAIDEPVEADILVVEGWLPDPALQEAAGEFQRGHYKYVVTAGGPLARGYFLSSYGTYASYAAAVLRKLGLPEHALIEAAGPDTLRNRTLRSARAVYAKLSECGIRPQGINVISEGTHARRTRVVYRKVFGGDVKVGIIAAYPADYDPSRWWKSSDGVKTTFAEFVGWCFEVFLDAGR